MVKNKTKGYIMGAIAAATYGMNPLFALPLYAEGMDASFVLLYRYSFALIILLIMIRWRGQSMRLSKRQLGPLALLGLLLGASSLLLFESYNYMAAGIASTILFVYPLMVAIIMAVFLHERLKPLTIICIAMALIGITLLYKGDGGASLSPVGTLFVLLSALTYAIYLVWVNRPEFTDIPTLVLTFYAILLGVVLFTIKPIVNHTFMLPPSLLAWGCTIALALLPTAVSFVCTTIAIQNIGSTPTAILGALEPLTAIFFGILLFGETLTARDITGLALILIAVSVVIAGDNISASLLRVRKLFPAFYHRIKHRLNHQR